jgi:hypothetical protein
MLNPMEKNITLFVMDKNVNCLLNHLNDLGRKERKRKRGDKNGIYILDGRRRSCTVRNMCSCWNPGFNAGIVSITVQSRKKKGAK